MSGKQNFGALRVLNDDIVQPHAGFGAHSHRNFEIFSYIIDGALTHQDSMGNTEALEAGGVQYMSAGTGVVHSEMNQGNAPVRFLQVWLSPDASGHPPKYGSLMTTAQQRRNTLLAVLQGTTPPPAWSTPLEPAIHFSLHQDATVVVSQTEAGHEHDIVLGAGRQAYIVCIEGSMDVCCSNSSTGGEGRETTGLKVREGAEVRAGGGGVDVKLTAGEGGAHFMLIEMKGG